MPVARHVGVDRRRDEQGEHGADGHAGGNHDADVEAALGAGAIGDEQRDNTDHHGSRRHQDGPQAHGGRLLDGRVLVDALRFLQLVGELHHQDAVLGDETDERHKADLRIDVDGAGADVERRIVLHHAVHIAQNPQHEERAEQRRRQADQDDEGIAEALELRRQHQVDQQQREGEGDGKGIAFLHELAAFALEVIGHAVREHFISLLLQEGHRFANGAARERHALQGRGIELLEGLEAVGLHRLAERNEGSTAAPCRRSRRAHGISVSVPSWRVRRAAPAGSPDSCGPCTAKRFTLLPPSKRRERGADILHGHAELVGPVLVDDEFGLRRLRSARSALVKMNNPLFLASASIASSVVASCA